MGCVRWFMLLSAVFCLCACKQQKGSKACLSRQTAMVFLTTDSAWWWKRGVRA